MTKLDAKKLDLATKALAEQALRPFLRAPGMTMPAWEDEVGRLREALEQAITHHIESMGVQAC